MTEQGLPVAYTITMQRVHELRPCAPGWAHFTAAYHRRYGAVRWSEPFPLERVAHCVRGASDLCWLLIALSRQDGGIQERKRRAQRMLARVASLPPARTPGTSILDDTPIFQLFLAMARYGEDANVG